MRSQSRWYAALATTMLLVGAPCVGADAPHRATILVDAFGEPAATLQQDWGYAALVEYGGKRILFDTGNDADAFARNVRTLGIDLTRLDFVVISHRHGDHTDGLRHLLAVNPSVTIYAPDDEYFGGATPQAFFQRQVPELPTRMRYFGGKVPAAVPHGSPWRAAKLVLVADAVEVSPGIRIVRNKADAGPFADLPELSLAIETPDGQVLVVGCSHPGIERILRSVGAPGRKVHSVVGGLHLVTAPDAEIERLVGVVKDELAVAEIAPGHCTGEPAFAAFQRKYGDRYRYAGVGTVIGLPSPERR
ncbi:MAG TPA: MBL fold metallo-hydrolase [Steroidobacteraceae bacterium]|nr:MBL fold metallo-hydrolase [Steroidobacteraceae bacterium]